MAEPAPRKSYLIVVLVIVVALVVVIAKTTTKHNAGPQLQSQTAQLPAENPVAKIAAAVPADSTKVGAPEPPPATEPPAADEPEATAKPTPPNEAAPAPKPQPPAPPKAEPATAQEPLTPQEPAKKEVEPLPGSKLAECLESGRPTMADFGAGWCQPCKMMEPVLKEAARKYQGKANIVYVDTDKFPQIARNYKIRAIPTQIFFDAKGEKVSEHIGYWPIEDIARALAAAGVAE